MSLNRDKFRALCAAIDAFQREMDDANMKSSIVINLDLPDFQGVMHSADQMFGYTIMPDGSVKIMDAIVRPRRLADTQ